MIYQTPLPPDFWTWLLNNKAWQDFPVVFLLAAFALLVFFLGRWFWLDYKKEAKRDRDWREAQNKEREKSQDARDEKMQAFFKDINVGNATDIADMRTTSERITTALDALLINYGAHDVQAKEIRSLVMEIRLDVAKLTNNKKDA